MTNKTFEGVELPLWSNADAAAYIDGARREELDDMENMIQRRKLADESNAPLPLHRWTDVGNNPPPRNWVIPGWLPSGAVTLLSGPGGTGKSTYAIQLAAAVAGNASGEWGGPAIDRRLEGGAPVVFASWEDQPADITRKLADMSGKRFPWVNPEMPLHIAGDRLMGMTGAGPLWEPPRRMERGMLTPLASRLMAAAEEVKADLVILDSAAACYADNENDRAAVRAFLVHFHEWAIHNAAAVLLLGHPPKSGASYSGSTDWQAGCRALWTLGREPWGQKSGRGQKKDECPAYWKLDCEKSNYADGGPPAALRLDWQGKALMSNGTWDPSIGTSSWSPDYDPTV